MNSVKLFEKLASYTWQRILYSEEFKISQGEETITDLNLLEIAMSQYSGVKVIKTAKYDEKNQGADWEWWIGNSSIGYLRYAVQAKKIDKKFIHYKSLGHKVESERQIHILERYARNNGAIPLYCFYNYSKNTDLSPYWHCNLPPDDKQLGCTVTPLENVKEALDQRGKRTFDYLHKFDSTKPWRCLVQCPSLLHFYKNAKKTTDTLCLSWGFDNVDAYYEELPDCLSFAIEHDSTLRPTSYRFETSETEKELDSIDRENFVWREDNFVYYDDDFYRDFYPKRIIVADYLGDSL
jgi:hypothetical protein